MPAMKENTAKSRQPLKQVQPAPVRTLEAKVVAIGNSRGVRLSWEDTYKDMARAREDWSDLDTTALDGLEKEPW